MSKEANSTFRALKLALEALEGMYIQGFTQDDSPINNAITALREALAKPDFWEGYVPEPVKPAQQDSTCSNALRAQGKAYPRTCKKCRFGPCVELAQQALDKMAENARELGLDYEPAQQESALDMCEHRCPQVTWHRGPSFVCQKAGHGVGQNSYCEKCECPQAIEAAHGIKENT